MTQLFDQMTVPDPRPVLSRAVDVHLELDRIFNTPESNALDLSRFSSGRTARRAHKARPHPLTWLRSRAPGMVLVVAGAALGVAVARL